MKIHPLIQEMIIDVRDIRRYLHQTPELGCQEVKTQAFIYRYLEELGFDIVIKIADTGIKAVMYAVNPKKTFAFRADMDALNINEENQLDYSSKISGRMHACGHDGHMAVLLGLAKLISQYKSHLTDNVVLLFQPAEESIGGAQRMIQENALIDPNVDMIFGLHMMPDIPEGKIGLNEGPIMAQTSEFNIEIIGKSSHGAMPHRGIDSIVASAHFITLIQSIITRYVDPFEKSLISIGHISGGERRNIIAERTIMEGIIRTFSDDVYLNIKNRILAILQGIEIGFNVVTHFEETTYYPVVSNDVYTYEFLYSIIEENNIVKMKPLMIAEDFSFFQKTVPGAYFFLGCGNKLLDIEYPLHSNRFNFNEDVLLIGIEIYRRILNIM